MLPDERSFPDKKVSCSLNARTILCWAAELAYVGSQSRKYTSLVDSNPFVLGTTNRLYNQANGIDSASGLGYSFLDTFRNVGTGNYNSLQTQLRKQTSHWDKIGTTYFQLSYTWAKNLDNASGFRQNTSEVPFYNPKLFYAPSDLDVRHRIVFSGGWDLPFDEYVGGKAKIITHGWSLYPIVSYQTGFPLTAFANLSRSISRPGPSGAGDSELVKVNLVGTTVTTLSPHQNVVGGAVQYISPSNFNVDGLTNGRGEVPTNPSYGTLPRNFFRGPGRQNIDLSVAKLTPLLGERLTFELRGDFFNLLNTPEFANPTISNLNFGAPQFGQITNTYADSFRIIQLAGKLHF